MQTGNALSVKTNAHGLACDGLQIAKDDLMELENAQKRDDIVHELFQNAARIRGAMKSNRLLRPTFHKYKHACREILQQKKDEASQLLILHDYCESCTPHSNHDLKMIQSELRMHTKSLEGLCQLHDSDSDSDSDSDQYDQSKEKDNNGDDYDNEYEDDNDDKDDDDNNDSDNDDKDDDDCNSEESTSSSSSSSTSSFLAADMSDFPNEHPPLFHTAFSL